MVGTLYVVGTPIGNLSDLTFRAETTLKAVNLIAAEDTRTSKKLLRHYNIDTPLIAYHDNNEINQAMNLVNKLNSGDSKITIVTGRDSKNSKRVLLPFLGGKKPSK